ncbi:MAG: hypothetical protein KDD52_07590 [Bdellovibrionales bacterium]|nr:hypothetical protein [Bdellovibrionales bacterium]
MKRNLQLRVLLISVLSLGFFAQAKAQVEEELNNAKLSTYAKEAQQFLIENGINVPIEGDSSVIGYTVRLEAEKDINNIVRPRQDEFFVFPSASEATQVYDEAIKRIEALKGEDCAVFGVIDWATGGEGWGKSAAYVAENEEELIFYRKEPENNQSNQQKAKQYFLLLFSYCPTE